MITLPAHWKRYHLGCYGRGVACHVCRAPLEDAGGRTSPYLGQVVEVPLDNGPVPCHPWCAAIWLHVSQEAETA